MNHGIYVAFISRSLLAGRYQLTMYRLKAFLLKRLTNKILIQLKMRHFQKPITAYVFPFMNTNQYILIGKTTLGIIKSSRYIKSQLLYLPSVDSFASVGRLDPSESGVCVVTVAGFCVSVAVKYDRL